MAETSKTKGIVFQHAAGFVRDRFGKADLEDFSNSWVSQSGRTEFESAQMALWYPTQDWVALLEAIAERFFDGDPAAITEFGSYALERDLIGVYRAFVAIASPSFALKAVPSVWLQYNNTGTSSVVEKSRNHAILTLHDYSHPCPHEWHFIAGGTICLLNRVGAKNIRHELLDPKTVDGAQLVLRANWD